MTKAYQYNRDWRYNHPDIRYQGKKRYYDKTRNAPNQRARWSLEEIEMVLKHEIPDSELSIRLGRGVQAIQAARHRFRDRGENNEK